MSFIDEFEKRYNYNCDYMREMEQHSPGGFKTFVNFMGMSQYINKAPDEIMWTARITTTQTEDCGSCLQLVIYLALEQGVDSKLIKNILHFPNKLPDKIKNIYDYSKAIALNKPSSINEKIEAEYGKEIITELALAIASAKVYPTIKRAMGHAKSCSLYDFSFSFEGTTASS